VGIVRSMQCARAQRALVARGSSSAIIRSAARALAPPAPPPPPAAPPRARARAAARVRARPRATANLYACILV
jgi:hypothetical protein